MTDAAQARVTETAVDLLAALDRMGPRFHLTIHARTAREELRRALALAAAADAERERLAA